MIASQENSNPTQWGLWTLHYHHHSHHWHPQLHLCLEISSGWRNTVGDKFSQSVLWLAGSLPRGKLTTLFSTIKRVILLIPQIGVQFPCCLPSIKSIWLSWLTDWPNSVYPIRSYLHIKKAFYPSRVALTILLLCTHYSKIVNVDPGTFGWSGSICRTHLGLSHTPLCSKLWPGLVFHPPLLLSVVISTRIPSFPFVPRLVCLLLFVILPMQTICAFSVIQNLT